MGGDRDLKAAATAPAVERRLFLENHEVPGLLLGSLRGERVALRRVLGARRGGRIGSALALLALLAASAPSTGLFGAALVLWIALCGLGRAVAHRASGLRLHEWLRLTLWTAAPALLGAALLRGLLPSAWLTLVAVAVACALSWRGVRRGLG
jgi:hypothetical protein